LWLIVLFGHNNTTDLSSLPSLLLLESEADFFASLTLNLARDLLANEMWVRQHMPNRASMWFCSALYHEQDMLWMAPL
jgi:hypothetical protein